MGKVEGPNNKIKVTKGNAYGFRKDWYFTLRLYALHNCRITRNVCRTSFEPFLHVHTIAKICFRRRHNSTTKHLCVHVRDFLNRLYKPYI